MNAPPARRDSSWKTPVDKFASHARQARTRTARGTLFAPSALLGRSASRQTPLACKPGASRAASVTSATRWAPLRAKPAPPGRSRR